MDSTDCFILDAGAKIYVYLGSGSSAFEKQKATSMAETMESERGGRSERVDREFANCSEVCRRSRWVSLKQLSVWSVACSGRQLLEAARRHGGSGNRKGNQLEPADF